MKFFGNANMQKNQVRNAALESVAYFPQDPVVGLLAFVNSIVYICTRVTPAPAIWVPLTREITCYTHIQSAPSMTWTIVHDLATTSVNVQIFDEDNKFVIPDEIEVVDYQTIIVTTSTPTVGKANVITGHIDGNVRPTYAYTWFQTDAATTWTVPHNLGYDPIVRIFIGNYEVQPASIVHDSTNQLTVTFTTPQAGYARLI